MEAYLDNAATTMPFESVRNIMQKTLGEDFGNPSSMHQKGIDAEKYIKETREIIAKSLKAEPKEIIFTSGGTESNNMAIIGTALANKRAGRHIITTGMEHASVYNPFIFLEEQGFEVTFLSVNAVGKISVEELENAIREDTILVSIMFVNNEIGAVQDLEAIGALIKRKNPHTLFHTDAVQGYGKFKINPKKCGIDLLSASGHKLHGPKGSGFLYIKRNLKIKPIIYGGEQQDGLRSGTENVPAIAGLGAAVKEYLSLCSENQIFKMYKLKSELILRMLEITGVSVNGVGDKESIEEIYGRLKQVNEEADSGKDGGQERGVSLDELCGVLQAPHIISLTFSGVRSEVMLHALEEKNIYVSSGSACASNHPGISGTLKAVGLKNEALTSTLRFSLSVFTKQEEILLAVREAATLYPVLSRYKRK